MEAEGTSEVVIIGLDDKDHWCYGDKYDKWINGNTIIKQQNNPNHLGERSNFEEDKKNCSTKIFLRKTQLLKYFGQDIKSQEACNFGYFNNYLKKYGTFAGEGVWYAPPTGAPSVQGDFYPSGCSFTRFSRGDYLLSECFEKKKICKILVTGDSNARMLTKNMIQLFEDIAGKKCKKIAFQNAENDTKYFDVPNLNNSKILTKPCGFGLISGGSWRYQCPMDYSSNGKFEDNVTIEFIAMFRFVDLSMQLSLDEGNATRRIGLLSANNKLEYLLKYYLPYNGFPDMWIFSPPFHHESLHHNLTVLKVDSNYLINIMNSFVPARTKIIFMADARKCNDKLPKHILQTNKQQMNVSMNERIDQMNRLWYAALRPKIDNSKNWNVLLDATKITCPLVCTWHIDGAHYVGVWYKLMSEYILSILCHS
ncbi:hypothetical protein LSH36_174g09061 [Paralvinella palmiformis]|uniref:Uncharacterized protein n=1 Tax=Paralvinella palmiformis TaxID=53620 RepID=A0AAD9JTB0_9ANNE|nr:hypothetical protein LSH36_174g09061 [Paralvinella palmiformis]